MNIAPTKKMLKLFFSEIIDNTIVISTVICNYYFC